MDLLPTQEIIGMASELTALIASQGLFALAAVYILLMQVRRASRGDTPPPRVEVVRNYVVVALTVVLTVTAGAVWTVQYLKVPLYIASGSVSDLRDVEGEAEAPGDTVVQEWIEPYSTDVAFFASEVFDRRYPIYRLNWLVTSRDPIRQLRFQLRRYYEVYDVAREGRSQTPVERGTPKWVFELPADKVLEGALSIAFVQDAEDPLRRSGRLILFSAEGQQDLRLVQPAELVAHAAIDRDANRSITEWALSALFPALNAQTPPTPRVPPGSLTATLFGRLAGNRWSQRDAAIRTLIEDAEASMPRLRVLLRIASSSSVENPRETALVLDAIEEVLEQLEVASASGVTELRRELAESLFDNGQYSAAANQFARLDEEGLTDHLRQLRAGSYYQAGRFGDAFREFRALREGETDPTEEGFFATMEGYSSLMLGDTAQAIASLEYAGAIQPELATALVGAAELHAIRGDSTEHALDLMSRALEVAPRDAEILTRAAWVLCLTGDPGSASESFRLARAQPDADADLMATYSEFLAERGCAS